MRRLSQFCAVVFAVLALLALTSDRVEARRGVRIGMLVPSFTKSESVVKVLELPNIPAFTDPKGRHVDLGYYWPSIGDGQ